MDMTQWLALLEAGDYTIAREVIQRGVAALFVLAFLSSYHQFPVLLGERGLLPAGDFLDRPAARRQPSLFHWRAFAYSDRLLRIFCLIGMLLGIAVVVGLPQQGRSAGHGLEIGRAHV